MILYRGFTFRYFFCSIRKARWSSCVAPSESSAAKLFTVRTVKRLNGLRPRTCNGKCTVETDWVMENVHMQLNEQQAHNTRVPLPVTLHIGKLFRSLTLSLLPVSKHNPALLCVVGKYLLQFAFIFLLVYQVKTCWLRNTSRAIRNLVN